jgi:hypothetical protein
MIKCDMQVGYYKDLLEIAARLAVGEAAHAQRVEAAAWRMEHKGCNHATRKAAKHARLRAWRAALAELEGADKDAARAERAAFFAGRPPDTLVSKLLQAQGVEALGAKRLSVTSEDQFRAA